VLVRQVGIRNNSYEGNGQWTHQRVGAVLATLGKEMKAFRE
jgi:hypothetical protein